MASALILVVRYIKMSSPYLNNMIIIGCLLTYTSVILLGLDSHLTSESALPVICTARIWTLMAGFTLAFGSMFSKTWRVHSIFTDVKLNKKAIKDYQLFMVVGVLLTIDIAILTTWQVIDPFYRETKLLEPYVSRHFSFFFRWRRSRLFFFFFFYLVSNCKSVCVIIIPAAAVRD
jgi:gamma-aminobutyric acid type B receptor